MTDADIETIARTICMRNGQDPDEKIVDDRGVLTARWKSLKRHARSDIEAFRDCQALAGFAPHMGRIK